MYVKFLQVFSGAVDGHSQLRNLQSSSAGSALLGAVYTITSAHDGIFKGIHYSIKLIYLVIINADNIFSSYRVTCEGCGASHSSRNRPRKNQKSECRHTHTPLPSLTKKKLIQPIPNKHIQYPKHICECRCVL